MRFFLLLLGVLISTFAYAQPFVAQRVISLSPHTTELAYSAGLGDKLIAVSDHSDYPPAARKLEKVASYRGINIERIVQLQPDLILAWQGGNNPRDMAKLQQLGFTILYSHPETFQDIANTLIQFGQYSSDPAKAKQKAEDFLKNIDAIRQEYRNAQPISYLYTISTQPLMTMSQDQWPAPIFSICGGINAFHDSRVAYPQIGLEQVLLKQPQAIFSTNAPKTINQYWQPWKQQLLAAQQGHLYSINADWLNRPTLRSLQAIRQICADFDRLRHQLNAPATS